MNNKEIKDNSVRNKILAASGIVVVIAALLFSVNALGLSSSGYNTLLDSQKFMSTYENTANAELIDVRTPAEFGAGHISGAIDVDFEGSDFETKIKTLDPTKTYFVYCRSGNRSAQATAIMQKDGIEHIYQLQGGVESDLTLLK